eukprot:3232963-Rhodomonas_salina.6
MARVLCSGRGTRQPAIASRQAIEAGHHQSTLSSSNRQHVLPELWIAFQPARCRRVAAKPRELPPGPGRPPCSILASIMMIYHDQTRFSDRTRTNLMRRIPGRDDQRQPHALRLLFFRLPVLLSALLTPRHTTFLFLFRTSHAAAFK